MRSNGSPRGYGATDMRPLHRLGLWVFLIGAAVVIVAAVFS